MCDEYLKTNKILNYQSTEIRSSILTLRNTGFNYFDGIKLNFSSNFVRKGYIPLLRIYQFVDIGIGRYVETYPDYLGFINEEQNVIEDLSPVFNASRYPSSNILINIGYNENELVNYTVSYSYNYFGYYKPFICSLFAGNYISFSKTDVLIQNADIYPFKGIKLFLI